MTSTTRSLIERPDLDAEFSEQVNQDSIDRLAIGLSIVAAIMIVFAAASIIFGSASLISLMIISLVFILLITTPSSS